MPAIENLHTQVREWLDSLTDEELDELAKEVEENSKCDSTNAIEYFRFINDHYNCNL